MFHLLDLRNDLLETPQEALGVVIVKDIQVNTLAAACKECLVVTFGLDASSDRSKYECSRVDGLQIPSRHLQYDRVGCGDDGNDLRASFYTSAPFIFLRLICGYLKI